MWEIPIEAIGGHIRKAMRQARHWDDCPGAGKVQPKVNTFNDSHSSGQKVFVVCPCGVHVVLSATPRVGTLHGYHVVLLKIVDKPLPEMDKQKVYELIADEATA